MTKISAEKSDELSLFTNAGAKLEESGDAGMMSRIQATFFLALAGQAYPELRGRRQGEWLDRLERENDNL